MSFAKDNRSGTAYAVRYTESGSPIFDEEVGTFKEQENGDIKLSLTKLPWGGAVLLTRPQPPKPQSAKVQREPN
jgi:hypothetical protein